MMTAESPRRTEAMHGVSFLWLEITAKCNLACSHCYAESGPSRELFGAMNYGDWERVLVEAAELGCREVQFIGGEPTMHPRLHDLVDRANHLGYQFIEVFTNATRIDPALIGCFQRNGVRVATSFYSDAPVVHERVTQGRGSWQRTVQGIEQALSAGLRVRVGITETEHNLGHGSRAAEFLGRLGVRDIRIDRQRGVGRSGLLQLGEEGERYEELCGECWKGKLCVTSSGDVFPCVFSRTTRVGNARTDCVASILQSAKLQAFRRKLRLRAGGDPGDDQQCNPLSTCNPNDCNPNACNPLDCNPNGSNCNPCNPCGPS